MTWSIGNKEIRFRNNSSLAPLENLKKSKGTFLAGLTLLELLIVVTIIVGLLALSLPRFRGTFNNLRFNNFCQNIAARMIYLQERAGFQQNTYRLNFDLSNRVVEIDVKEKNEEEFKDVKELLGKKITIPRDVEIELDVPSIVFFPDGTIAGRDIKIRDDQNRVIILINESIGRIKLKRDE